MQGWPLARVREFGFGEPSPNPQSWQEGFTEPKLFMQTIQFLLNTCFLPEDLEFCYVPSRGACEISLQNTPWALGLSWASLGSNTSELWLQLIAGGIVWFQWERILGSWVCFPWTLPQTSFSFANCAWSPAVIHLLYSNSVTLPTESLNLGVILGAAGAQIIIQHFICAKHVF